MDPAGAVAVVTGASSGIGAATARALAASGATIVAVARREQRLATVVEDCRATSPGSRYEVCDVADRRSCERLVVGVERRFGRIDVLVNNAGIPMRRHADELTFDDVEQVMAVNFSGAVALTLAVLPGMRRRDRGVVVNVTSVSGDVPVPRAAAYGASKAALSRFSHGLAVDLAATGVHVAVVSPGPIDTEIWDRGSEAAQYQGKLHPPEVVADAIVAAIRHERTHVTAPRRYGIPAAVYPLVQRPLRWALTRFARASGDPPPHRKDTT